MPSTVGARGKSTRNWKESEDLGDDPEDEWTFEVQMAAKLTEYARPEDRFAIVLGGAEGVGMAFESPANTRQRLKELKSSRPVAVDSARIYDALLAASSLLSPVRFGDTLFLFGRPEDLGSKADLNQITESILRNRLRLYGESFYDPLAAQLPSNFDPNKPIPSAVSIPKLVNVSAATGYYISFHAAKTLNIPGQTRLFESFLGRSGLDQVLTQIAENGLVAQQFGGLVIHH